MNYLEWKSMIACGANLTEILEWERGRAFVPVIENGIAKEKFPNWFKAKVLAFYELSNHERNHIQDAATPK
jgi:hypothetical protein